MEIWLPYKNCDYSCSTVPNHSAILIVSCGLFKHDFITLVNIYLRWNRKSNMPQRLLRYVYNPWLEHSRSCQWPSVVARQWFRVQWVLPISQRAPLRLVPSPYICKHQWTKYADGAGSGREYLPLIIFEKCSEIVFLEIEGHGISPFQSGPTDWQSLDCPVQELNLYPAKVRKVLNLLHLPLCFGVKFLIQL